MTYEEKRMRDALEAIISLAYSNFPAPTYIRIECVGSNSGSIILPAHFLKSQLKEINQNDK